MNLIRNSRSCCQHGLEFLWTLSSSLKKTAFVTFGTSWKIEEHAYSLCTSYTYFISNYRWCIFCCLFLIIGALWRDGLWQAASSKSQYHRQDLKSLQNNFFPYVRRSSWLSLTRSASKVSLLVRVIVPIANTVHVQVMWHLLLCTLGQVFKITFS